MTLLPLNLDCHIAEDADVKRPLADRLRPQSLKEILGQSHILEDHSVICSQLAKNSLSSMIFWGPPGCGKTTLARILAQESGMECVTISAISHATSDLRKIFETAKQKLAMGKRTLLLVDEIHHFNRSQQDLFLPYVEDGTIVLIGATTENPSFELNAALLSRCEVVVLNRLDEDALSDIIVRAESHNGKPLPLDEEAKEALCQMADGDGRYVLNLCELLFSLDTDHVLGKDALLAFLQKRMPLYDKSGDGHYNLISALHKSLRGSDVDASLYWLARMLAGGEQPLYIIRRLVRFANEDIGLADPEAIHQALAAKEAFEFLGFPEGELSIAQAVVYLATAPKSNAAYKAFKLSQKDAKTTGSLMPPKHILNAPTGLMKEQGYGKDYQYDHDTEEGFSGQDYFPETMKRVKYYTPLERGFEREVSKRLAYWSKLREKKEQ